MCAAIAADCAAAAVLACPLNSRKYGERSSSAGTEEGGFGRAFALGGKVESARAASCCSIQIGLEYTDYGICGLCACSRAVGAVFRADHLFGRHDMPKIGDLSWHTK